MDLVREPLLAVGRREKMAVSGETQWPKWHAPALPAEPERGLVAVPTLLGYPRTTERVSLETWMNLYCVLAPEQRTKEALKTGQILSRRWLATLPRP